jgi:hypothetical protein
MTVWAETATPGAVLPVTISHVTESGNGATPSITANSGIAKAIWTNDNARCASYVFLVVVSGSENYKIKVVPSTGITSDKHFDDVGNIDMAVGTTSPSLGFSEHTDNSGFYASVRNTSIYDEGPSGVILSGTVTMTTAGTFTITSVAIVPSAMTATIAQDGKSFTYSGGEVEPQALLTFWITLSASPTHEGSISITASSETP